MNHDHHDHDDCFDDEDEFDFKERFTSLKAEFEAQLVEEAKLNQAIAENLAKVII